MERAIEMPLQRIGLTGNYIGHPRFWEIRQEFMSRGWEPRTTPEQYVNATPLIASLHLETRGHLQRALGLLENAPPRAAMQRLHAFRMQGYPVPPEALDATLSVDTLQAAGSGHA